MTTLLASFIALIAAVAAMAIGVIFGRAPIRGSCGGAAGVCAACTGNCARRAAGGQEAGREKESC